MVANEDMLKLVRHVFVSVHTMQQCISKFVDGFAGHVEVFDSERLDSGWELPVEKVLGLILDDKLVLRTHIEISKVQILPYA